jgi:hypothetical protein
VAESDRDKIIWRKSEKSGGGGDCVEVAQWGDSILVRNSHDPSGPVLSFSRSQWEAFLEGARGGTFDFAKPGS